MRSILAYLSGYENNPLYKNHRLEPLMPRVKIFSTGTCPVCDKTKHLLKKWGIPYQEARLDLDPNERREFSAKTNGARTVPQILIDGEWIGSFSELTELHMDDKLDHLME